VFPKVLKIVKERTKKSQVKLLMTENSMQIKYMCDILKLQYA
jgi:hypothetical protein